MIHATLGASSAYRWMSCPGSVSLSKDIPRKETAYSKEGTAAHALSETAFAANLHPSNWLGEEIEGVVVTQDMVIAVEVYVDFLKGLAVFENQLMLEHRFDLSKLNPPAPMFGTSDCVCYLPGERKLIVADYKHGAGVPVEVEDNPQLKYYALGALLALDEKHRVDEIEMVIVQPRAPHKDGPIRRWSCSLTDLLDFSSELIESAHKAVSPTADLNPGKHCRFCPAQPMCPSLHEETKALAKVEFSDKPLLDPRLLSADEVGYILERADLIEDWVRSIRQHVQSELESGKNIPGWKLVPKRALRSWVNEGKVLDWAKTTQLEEDELFDKKLKSPAALEKVVGKKNLPTELFASVSSGYTLAPASDPRPAVTNVASDEFSALPPSVN
jgi:hypothetical protein